MLTTHDVQPAICRISRPRSGVEGPWRWQGEPGKFWIDVDVCGLMRYLFWEEILFWIFSRFLMIEFWNNFWMLSYFFGELWTGFCWRDLGLNVLRLGASRKVLKKQKISCGLELSGASFSAWTWQKKWGHASFSDTAIDSTSGSSRFCLKLLANL